MVRQLQLMINFILTELQYKWVDHIKHLGDTVNVKLNDVNDCDFKRCLFNASVNK